MSLIKNCLFCCLLLVSFYARAQAVKGKVYRAGTDSVIAGATVFYNSSTLGTITDEFGNFQLAARPSQIPINVSCIGYYTATVNYVPGLDLIVYLKPKTEQLKTVVIRADGMEREKEEALFLYTFLGSSVYARSCTVVNIKDIDIFFDKDTQTLSATCDNPIIIKNKLLGYTISYYLDRFTYRPGLTTFAGFYKFKDDDAGINSSKIKRDREDAYEGSAMQFLRALWNKQLKKAGFKILTLNYRPLTEDSILAYKTNVGKMLHLKYKILINHSSNRMLEGYLLQTYDETLIEKDGAYGPGLLWSGMFSRQRIGDLLPFEYVSAMDK